MVSVRPGMGSLDSDEGSPPRTGSNVACRGRIVCVIRPTFGAPEVFVLLTDTIQPDTFWSMLRATDHDTLRTAGTIHRHPPGTQLVQQGEPPHFVLVLLDGLAKVVAAGTAGPQTLLGIRRPGDLIGELSAVDGHPRSATVTAIDPITTLRIPRATFTALLSTNSHICHAVLEVVVARLRGASAARAEATGTTAAQRLTRLLDRLAQQHGNPHPDGIAIALPFSQEELASAIAASREAVVRALRTLRTAGIITTTRQQILIHSPQTLHTLAHSHPDQRVVHNPPSCPHPPPS